MSLQSLKQAKVTYFRLYFSNYVASTASLALSLVKIVSFLMRGSHTFSQSQAMVLNLFGYTQEEEKSGKDATVTGSEATNSFEERVKNRREFGVNFCSWLFYSYFISLCCCCFKSCCARSALFSEKMAKYKKFNMAIELISKE
mmetsp:Transcript_16262/g.22005  ORF Transcript_16262/g.22005 Transcript_16262/m.22005 type:complete len:143 (-) Transcript_16262:560-988(-)